MADHDHAELVRGLRSWRASSGYQPRVLEAADAIDSLTVELARANAEAAVMREERNAVVDDLCRWRRAFQSVEALGDALRALDAPAKEETT